MRIETLTTECINTLKQRRQHLSDRLDLPVLLWSGAAPSRNFAANRYPFRASSHFLYFAGVSLQNAVIYLHQGQMTLLMDDPTVEDALWYGESPTCQSIAHQIGADADAPLATLLELAEHAVTLPVQDGFTRQHQAQVLGRSVGETHTLSPLDRQLAEALVQLRLVHDPEAIAAIRKAVAVTLQAHRAGMAMTRRAQTEAQVRAAMEAVILAEDMTTAYASIVTVHGDILHNLSYHHPLALGDLLLADVGAEHPLGWAADVTRTWPVTGQWSASQRAIYDLVLAAHDACIDAICPDAEYRDIHLRAAQVITLGLMDLGILKGTLDSLMEQAAHALFFPHGIGHLLGLDVHDMEDLGDLAGYAPGRTRCDHDGTRYLRLDRPLQVGMVVTIEPGFYQINQVLQTARLNRAITNCVNWDRLAEFSDVRGIRIEDDILVTETGAEILTLGLPTQADEVVECINESA